MDAAVTPDRFGIGGNNPPIAEVLREKHEALFREVEEIADAANATPRQIETDADLDRVGKLVTSAGAKAREIDAVRKREKQPYLDAGREVDGVFATLTDRLDRIRSTFQRIADDHARRKAEEARRLREEEARRLREEEDRKRREAELAKRASTQARKLDEADAIADRAAEAEVAAQASAADLVRTRTESGTLATAETAWAFEIENFDAIPLDRLRPYLKREDVEKAIRLAVRQGLRELPGVRIFEGVKARFR